MLLAFFPNGKYPDATRPEWFLTVMELVMIGLFIFAPRRLHYELEAYTLHIRKLIGTVTLPYATLRVTRATGRLTMRTFGVGLPGYLTGLYMLSKDASGITEVQACASNPAGGMLVQNADWPYFLTPADPGTFLNELARRGVKVS